ncbi:XRE family transcriptional regulator [Vibrio harveyi]|uniref:helix-turn-helix domain-containing protein n=2 Tax=Vibrio harveyi TaxID=669 RepID=UPI00165D4706|nr:XRE family transcriptional regulator [Vibrio harveyi]ELI6428067.1 XRE family transcriptional regulator [Vibrio harveyi]
MSKPKSPLDLLTNDPVELSLITLKSKLVTTVKLMIVDNGWTQAQAATEIGVSQPRISNLMNGQLSKFSIDTLLEILGKLGYLMDVSFDPKDNINPIKMEIKRTAV